MKPNLDQLLQERERVLQQMHSVDRLRRGSLSQQFFKSPGKNAKTGPYYVLQGFLCGKKFSERIPAEQAEQAKRDVANYRHFQSLAEEFVTLTDQITRLEQTPKGSKKNSSHKRSPAPDSGKPKPSSG